MKRLLVTSTILLLATTAVAWQQLRFDAIPKEFTSPTGKYVPAKGKIAIPEVARDQLICFCLYTTHRGVLKLSAQLYPLREGEARTVTLHIERDGHWRPVATATADPVAWNALFRIEKWDDTRAARYRVTHAGGSRYQGVIRKNPRDRDEIVVANLSCNSNTDRNLKPDLVANLRALDPDLLFFGGDQSYDHRDHYAAWLLFGRQFGDLIKDRPTVTIPDDHDVGHGNVWGEGGGESKRPDGADGGYIMPVEYVNMVQRQQCGHLPDPFDSTPARRGIGVYYTALNVGGIDFAIIEDRKWKTGPAGLVRQQGPRPDHINDPAYDRQSVDVPEAQLLGERQLKFLRAWGQDWADATMKVVLSQTTFAGAAHLHGGKQDRLLADLDSNGWPQSGRNAALREIRKSFAFMMCGDQHLATVIHHGINDWADSGWQFTSPSIWNLYGRSWAPLARSERPWPGSTLPMTGDFYDGFGNKLTLAAYANPTPENFQATGYGLARFRKKTGQIVIECWSRFVDATKPGATQYAGFPVTIEQEDNYARAAIAWLPRLKCNLDNPVVQVVDEHNGEVVYTLRLRGREWSPKVFREGTYTVRVGEGKRRREFRGVASATAKDATALDVQF